MLTFDPVAHQYFWHGAPVVNVTRVLEPLTDFSKVDPHRLEIARQKGVAVHRMIELECKNDLDEDNLPAWMRPVLVEWRKFVADTGFKVIDSEQKVYHKKLGYAGQLDLYGSGHFPSLCNAYIDAKRSFLAGHVIGLQLAGYQEAHGDKDAKRFALRLKEGERYALEPYTKATDRQDFITCLAWYRLNERLRRQP